MLWRVVAGVLVVLYPAGVYYVLTEHDGRMGIIGLLSLSIAIAAVRLRGAQSGQRLQVLAMPGALALLAGASLMLDDHRFVLALPVLVNLILLSTFASTLWSDTPLVERFARMQVDDLSSAELTYCRSVTVIWSLFFIVNGGIAGSLAWLSPVSWWALYTGLISYLLIGMLGAGEYIVRKIRFGRYGSGLHDRLLSRLLPAPLSGRTEPNQ